MSDESWRISAVGSPVVEGHGTCLMPPTNTANRRHSSPSALAETASFVFPKSQNTETARFKLPLYKSETLTTFRRRASSETGPSVNEIKCGSLECDHKENHYLTPPNSGFKGNDFVFNYQSPVSRKGSGSSLGSISYISEDIEDEGDVGVLKLDSPPKIRKKAAERKNSSEDDRSRTVFSVGSPSSAVSEFEHEQMLSMQAVVPVTITPVTSPTLNEAPAVNEPQQQTGHQEDSCFLRTSQTEAISQQSVTVSKKPDGRFETIFDAILCRTPSRKSNAPLRTPPKSPSKSPPRSPILSWFSSKRKNTDRGSEQKLSDTTSNASDRKVSDSGRCSPNDLEVPRSPRTRSPSSSPPSPAPGVVVTSHRMSRRRSSITSAAIAFAAATAGASVSPATSPTATGRFKCGFRFRFQGSVDGHIVTMRVLKILKHWISKQVEVSVAVCYIISLICD